MNTVGTYFAFSKRAEAHRISAIQYSKLYRFLQIELSLPQQERMTPADLLKVSRDNYERLQEISPLIPYNILEHFKEKFKQYKVSKPSEANGLEEIIIYREDVEEIEEEEEEIEEQQIRESG
jgi:AraC-like DNA-binding protein